MEVAGSSRRAWLQWGATLLCACAALTLLLITSSYHSGTYDESNHVATGLEWWQFHTYEWWTETPPLARTSIALVPYLAGVRLPPREQWDPHTHPFSLAWPTGVDALESGAGYETNLYLARLGILPFFVLLLLGTWLLARGRRYPAAGLTAVALVSTLPSILAHSQLATSDIPLTATVVLFLVAVRRYLEAPSWNWAVTLGLMAGAGLATKFTFLAYAPVSVAAVLCDHRVRRNAARLKTPSGRCLQGTTIAGGVAALSLWSIYRFSFGAVDALPLGSSELRLLTGDDEPNAIRAALLSLPVPAPEWFHGLLFLLQHQGDPGSSYFWGQTSADGFALFYPVALLLKTPLPTLIGGGLSLLVLAAAQRRNSHQAAPLQHVPLWPWLFALAVLALASFSPVNLGTRHILPILPVLCVGIGTSVQHALALASRRLRYAIVPVATSLLVWQLAVVATSRHALLSYFNPLAGDEPGDFMLDSDYDWGQDLFRLREFARDNGIEELKIAFFGMIHQCEHGLPKLRPLPPGQPVSGWLAISETFYRGRIELGLLRDPCSLGSAYRPNEVQPQPYAWLQDLTPVARLGAVRVYYIPEQDKGSNGHPLRIPALTPPVIVEAETGRLGEVFQTQSDVETGAAYITTGTPPPDPLKPNLPARVATYELIVPNAGTYDIYLRYRVGAGRFDDDSVFLPLRLGQIAPDNATEWHVVNGLVSVGYTGAQEVVGGGVGQSVTAELARKDATLSSWRWLNVSAYRAASPGITVSLNAMKHAFQLGAREDGLDIDKFALVPTGVSQTVEQLDSGTAGFMIPSTPEPEPFVPPGPPLALKSKKYLGGVYSKSQVANFGAYFNHVTPENAGKWGPIEASRDVMEWRELDKAHALAKQALDPLPFRMHVLIWGNQQPAWIEQLPPAEQREEIEEWFIAVANRYGAGLDYVEVVNEPLHDPPSESGNGGGNYLNALGGSGKTGWDWVLNAFRLAREHFPHSKLMLNEYNVVNSEDVLLRYKQLVQLLVSENLLDVIGIQGHAFSTGVSAAQLTASLDSLAQVGLPIVVSELDVESKNAESQLTEYKRIFPVFWEHPAVEGIVLWGYRPGMWRGPQGAILAHENGAERPALKWLREYLRADDSRRQARPH